MLSRLEFILQRLVSSYPQFVHPLNGLGEALLQAFPEKRAFVEVDLGTKVSYTTGLREILENSLNIDMPAMDFQGSLHILDKHIRHIRDEELAFTVQLRSLLLSSRRFDWRMLLGPLKAIAETEKHLI